MKSEKQLEYTLAKLNQQRGMILERFPDNTFFLAMISMQVNTIEWVLERPDYKPLMACETCHIAYKGDACPNCGSSNRVKL